MNVENNVEIDKSLDLTNEAELKEKLETEYKKYLEDKYGVNLDNVEIQEKSDNELKFSYSKDIKKEIQDFYDLEKILTKMCQMVLPLDQPTFEYISPIEKEARKKEYEEFEKLLRYQITEVKKSFQKNATYRNDHTIMKIIELLENEEFDYKKDINLPKLQEIVLNYSAELSGRATNLLAHAEFKNIIVKKSNYFVEGSYCYNLVTQKILAIALSKLDSYADILGKEIVGNNKKLHEQNRRTVYIYTHDLIRYLDMDQSNASKALDQFEKDLKSLETLFLKEPDGSHVYIDTGNYFDDAKGVNISTGRTPKTMLKLTNMIGVSFTDEFLSYVTNLKDRYTQYSIGNIIKLKSKYSLRFYEIAKRYLGLWEITLPLDRLYFMLGIKSPSSFKVFHSKILKPSIQDIFDNTPDITVKYELIKIGRSYGAITLRIYEGKHTQTESDIIDYEREQAKRKGIKNIEDNPLQSIEAEESKKLTQAMEEFSKYKKLSNMEKILTNLEEIEKKQPR